MIQINICSCPIYLTYYPNITAYLTDPLILDTLVLNVYLSNNSTVQFKEYVKNFAFIYRVYFLVNWIQNV